MLLAEVACLQERLWAAYGTVIVIWQSPKSKSYGKVHFVVTSMQKDKMAEGLLRIEGVAYFVPTAMGLPDLLIIEERGWESHFG